MNPRITQKLGDLIRPIAQEMLSGPADAGPDISVLVEEGDWRQACLELARIAGQEVTGRVLNGLLAYREWWGIEGVLLAAECLVVSSNRVALAEWEERIRETILGAVEFDLPYPCAQHEKEFKEALEIQRRAVRQMAATWPDDRSHAWLLEYAKSGQRWAAREAAVQELGRVWRDEPRTRLLLEELVVRGSSTDRLAAMEALVRGWPEDADVVARLKNFVLGEKTEASEVGVQWFALLKGRDEEVFSFLCGLARERSSSLIREEAALEVAKGWPESPEAVELLLNFVPPIKAKLPRRDALLELIRIWRDEDKLLETLKSCAGIDNSYSVCKVALEALVERRPDDPEIADFLRERVMGSSAIFVRMKAMKLLRERYASHPETLPFFKACGADASLCFRHHALGALAKGWPEDPDTRSLLMDALSAEKLGTRDAALEHLARTWPEDREIFRIAQAQPGDEGMENWRVGAIDVLAEHWPGEPETLVILRDRVVHDTEPFVRGSALRKLIEIRGEKESLSSYREYAVRDEDKGVRETALGAIAAHWPGDLEAAGFLMGRIIEDPDETVGVAIIQSLVRDFRETEGVREAIFRLARGEARPLIRRGAMEALARGWRDDPETFGLVWEMTRADEGYQVRLLGVSELARGWYGRPEVRECLKGRAVEDPHEWVRRAAVETIGRTWRTEAWTLGFVRERAVEDADWKLRMAALWVLAKEWPKEPGVLEFVRSRGREDESEKLRTLVEREGFY